VKNVSTLLTAVLAVAVAVLYYLHFSGPRAAAVEGTGTVGGKPIVYVNTDSLLTGYEFFKDAQKAFEQKRTQLDLDLNSKGAALQREIQIFQQQAPGMIAAEAQAKQLQLQKRGADFEQQRQRAINDLGADEMKKNKELYDNIADYIQKYNKENGYHYVLGYSQGGGILFANPDLDVTQKIIDGLNKEYKATQSGTKADSTAKK
jgi:outer membrane protein